MIPVDDPPPTPPRGIDRRAFIGASAAGALTLVGYAGVVEPRLLRVTRHEGNRRTSPDEREVTVVQLTDLHLQRVGRMHRRIAHILEDVHPDLVVFTGDSVDRPDRMGELERFLGMLDSSVPKYAIVGNWEHWGGIDLEVLRRVYAKAGCRLLIDESVVHETRRRSLAITGVDDLVGGRPDLPRAFRGVPAGAKHLLLAHCPAHREAVQAHARPTLMLSGHTHGGQIAPLGWAPALPPGSGRYRAGWYRDGGAVPLYVSRGIGTSVVPVRLGAPPELAVFTLWV